MSDLIHELRLAARRLYRERNFTLCVLLTLGLGVGVLATMFALVDAVLLRALPFPGGERLIAVTHEAPALGLDEAGLSLGAWAHYRRSAAVEELAVYHEASVNLTDGTDPEQRTLALVTPSFFDVLGVRAAHGRLLRESDGVAGAEPVIVLGHDLWMRRYGGDVGLVGSTVHINERARTVVGILEERAAYPRNDVQLWMNLTAEADELRFAGFPRAAIGRLASGVSIERAQALLQASAGSLAGSLSDISQSELSAAGLRVHVRPLHGHIARAAAPALRLLLAAAALVLIVSVANAAGLILARAEHVRRDVAVRHALGAGRAHLLRHFAAEALLLAFPGIVLGLLAAAWTLAPAVAFAGTGVPRAETARIDARVVVPALLMTGLLAITLLAVPAFRFRSSLRSTSEDLRARTSPPAAARVRRLLVTAQVALCMALLVGAVLLGRSFMRLQSVEPGFESANALTFELRLPFDRFQGAGTEQFHAALAGQLRAVPGVAHAAMTTGLPLTSSATRLAYQLEIDGRSGTTAPVTFVLVTPGFFETLGIAVRAGWIPETDDRVDERRRVVISAALARRLGAGDAILGTRIRRDVESERTAEWLTVAGVVDDVHDRSLTHAPGEIVYVPVLDETTDPAFNPDLVTWVVRTESASLERLSAIRDALRRLDARIPMANVRTLDAVVADATAHMRFAALLIALGALLATVLSLVGVWGVVAWSVASRTREFGLRMALGARARDVDALVLAGALRVLLTGLGVGVLPAFLVARAMRSQLYAVAPLDPVVWLISAVALIVAATIAAWIPASRAGRTSPARALAAD